jgi:hypothetical protein
MRNGLPLTEPESRPKSLLGYPFRIDRSTTPKALVKAEGRGRSEGASCQPNHP